jgi:hypothetical protein
MFKTPPIMSTILPQNRNVTHAVPKKGSEGTAFVWNSENGSLSSYIVFNVPMCITKHYKIKAPYYDENTQNSHEQTWCFRKYSSTLVKVILHDYLYQSSLIEDLDVEEDPRTFVLQLTYKRRQGIFHCN